MSVRLSWDLNVLPTCLQSSELILPAPTICALPDPEHGVTEPRLADASSSQCKGDVRTLLPSHVHSSPQSASCTTLWKRPFF